MSDSLSSIELNKRDASARAPGEMLRVAREAQGLSLEKLASMLKVSPAKLSALEEGRLDQLPDAGFARALAKTICRLLNIDAEAVLAGLPRARVEPLLADKPALNQPFNDGRLMPNMFQGGRGRLLAQLLRPQWVAPVLLLLAAAIIYALPESFERPLWGGGVSPVASQALPSASTDDASLPAAAVPQTTFAEISSPSAAAASSQALGAKPSVRTQFSPLPESVGAVSVSSSSPAALGPVSIRVVEDSWIEVIDGEGNARVSRIVRAGESMSMGGVPPWRVRIGHAGGVQVTLRGLPLDLTPYTRNNVARLELK